MSHVTRTFTAAALSISLAGCATGPNHIYPGLYGQKVVGNAVSVSVTNVWNQADAMPLADRHCQTFDKIARFVAMEGAVASFDCVKP